jgi:hypothetical protein
VGLSKITKHFSQDTVCELRVNVDTVTASASLINGHSESNIQTSLLIILRILHNDIIVIFVMFALFIGLLKCGITVWVQVTCKARMPLAAGRNRECFRRPPPPPHPVKAFTSSFYAFF